MSTELDSITFVCTANMCRSPIAEHIFRIEAGPWIAKLEVPLEINSRGTHAHPGEVRCDVASLNFSISDPGVSSAFAKDDVQTRGLVLTMEQMHVAYLVREFPKLRNRIFTLAQAVEILEHIYDGIVDGSLFVSADPELAAGFVAPPLPPDITNRWKWILDELDANRGFISSTNSILTSGDFDIGDAHVSDGPTHELSLDLVKENATELARLLELILSFSDIAAPVTSEV